MFKAFLVSAFRFSKEIEKLITIRIVASSKIDTAFLFLVLFAFWGRFLFVSFLVWGFRIFYFFFPERSFRDGCSLERAVCRAWKFKMAGKLCYPWTKMPFQAESMLGLFWVKLRECPTLKWLSDFT